ncbi:MAG: sodium:glutamate symporter [Spirochaetaceae bacterium]
MDFNWLFFVHLGLIGFALLVATVIRVRVRFFQKYLIPNALTAGFLLLPFYNYLGPALGVTQDGLGELVYHLLSISFVSMTLRRSDGTGTKGDKRIFATSVSVLSQYAVQAFLGLIVTYIFIKTILPELFPAFGFLLPLGFVLGPGQAFAIGQGWSQFGFEGAGTIGLTFAAIGFIVSSFGGVFLINFGIRRGWLTEEFLQGLKKGGVRSGVLPRSGENPTGARLTTESEAIDSMTYHAGMVLFVYFLGYLVLRIVTYLLGLIGPMGAELAVNLWGISFIFAAVMGIVLKQILKALRVDYTLDNQTLTRISGFSVDVMVTAAIAAISIVVVTEYLVPILLLSGLASLFVFLTVPWFVSRIFRDHQFHRMLMIFGVSTGTLPTGLALLRVIDPEFETPVASDYMYASGLIFMLAIPFILSINLPAYWYRFDNELYFWAAVGVSLAYMLFVFVSYLLVAKERSFARANKVWLPKHDK